MPINLELFFFHGTTSIMSWLKAGLRNSVLSFFTGGDDRGSVVEARTEEIRQVMIDMLGRFGEEHYPQIARRIRYAQDAQGLWYARGDLMTVLSAVHGETQAHRKLQGLRGLFEGLLPPSLQSRNSSLASVQFND